MSEELGAIFSQMTTTVDPVASYQEALSEQNRKRCLFTLHESDCEIELKMLAWAQKSDRTDLLKKSFSGLLSIKILF